jgi:hypothetical protein
LRVPVVLPIQFLLAHRLPLQQPRNIRLVDMVRTRTVGRRHLALANHVHDLTAVLIRKFKMRVKTP